MESPSRVRHYIEAPNFDSNYIYIYIYILHLCWSSVTLNFACNRLIVLKLRKKADLTSLSELEWSAN